VCVIVCVIVCVCGCECVCVCVRVRVCVRETERERNRQTDRESLFLECNGTGTTVLNSVPVKELQILDYSCVQRL